MTLVMNWKRQALLVSTFTPTIISAASRRIIPIVLKIRALNPILRDPKELVLSIQALTIRWTDSITIYVISNLDLAVVWRIQLMRFGTDI